MSRFALAVAVLAFLAPLVAAEDAASFAPREVLATPSDASALVAWAPGDVPADSYRVYGLNPHAAPERLFDSAATGNPATFAATVSGGFATYAVSGVFLGAESGLVEAAAGPCDVTIETDPVDVSTDCLKAHHALKVRRF